MSKKVILRAAIQYLLQTFAGLPPTQSVNIFSWPSFCAIPRGSLWVKSGRSYTGQLGPETWQHSEVWWCILWKWGQPLKWRWKHSYNFGARNLGVVSTLRYIRVSQLDHHIYCNSRMCQSFTDNDPEAVYEILELNGSHTVYENSITSLCFDEKAKK